MRRVLALGVLALLSAALFGGCGKVEDRVILRITDNDGKLAPRTVTVGYVNDRLEGMPAKFLPSTPGDEGKKEFLEEIVRKELLVIAGLRLGVDKQEGMEQVRASLEQEKARQMLVDDLVNKPAEPTQAELEEFNKLRETSFELRNIITPTLEEAQTVYRRVTEGGEEFEQVAKEIIEAGGTPGGLGQTPKNFLDIHPVFARAIKDLARGEVTNPIPFGTMYHVIQVVARKEVGELKPLEGSHLAGVLMEARNYKRFLRDSEVTKEWMEAANPVYNEEAVALAAKKIGEKAATILPGPLASASFEDRMKLTSTKVVPDLTPDEAKLELVRYKIGKDEQIVTLGDFQTILSETDGMEGVKSGDPAETKSFITARILEQSKKRELDARAYAKTKELQDSVAERLEEALVNATYAAEVVQKTPEPTGDEVKGYYRSHLSDFVEPVSVDVQQIIVGTEAQANSIRQKLMAGEGTFTDFVKTYSIDEWSKAKDGIIAKYYQGERRLDYLQGVAFSLGINEVSEPVRAPGGYAIVKVLAKYPEVQLTFDQVGNVVKDSVVNIAREKRLNELFDEVRGSVTVETLDENLKYVKDPAELIKQAQEGAAQPGAPRGAAGK